MGTLIGDTNHIYTKSTLITLTCEPYVCVVFSFQDEEQTLSRLLWSRYQPGVRPSGLSKDSTLVYADPHVLSTPVITDFNDDGSEDELVLSVNYYFDQKGHVYFNFI